MSTLSYIAAPLSRARIRQNASDIRELFGFSKTPRFPLLHVIENLLPQAFPESTFEVVDPAEMKGMYAEALPAAASIRIRNDVYMRAVSGSPRDNFTLAHELGHLVLHMDHRLQRLSAPLKLKPYLDPEWQANTFAGELLVPLELYKKLKHSKDACDIFGVSKKALDVQIKAWKDEGVL
ncbi:ImmA/IrrE family metallo-endopeptidase [Azospirillum sp. CT11-132]|uniref:ImmA/IrrE family metallo-endopeptidase n=1 Tax=Azospirillum sp. CT11-132 TaxID=3396317 RepID=UPI0039A542FB